MNDRSATLPMAAQELTPHPYVLEATGISKSFVQGGLNVQVLNNIDAQLQALQGNLSVVCLNDALNGNQLQVLNNILNNSPILNNNLNNSLNNLSALNNLNILGGARVLAVDLAGPNVGNVYVLGQ